MEYTSSSERVLLVGRVSYAADEDDDEADDGDGGSVPPESEDNA